METNQYKYMFDAEDCHWWYIGNHENFIKLLRSKKLLKEGIDVLDAGCGTGGWLKMLKSNYNINETGLDNHDIALEMATTRQLNNLIKGDVNKCEFPESSFDIITCFDVIYHRDVKDYDAVNCFYKELKDDGILLLSVPAFSFLQSKHDEVVHTGKRYTKKQIRILLESNGFEIVKLTYTVSLLFPFALIKRLSDKLFLSRKKEHNEVTLPPTIINKLFQQIMRFESKLMEFISFPFGLSVIALAKKRK